MSCSPAILLYHSIQEDRDFPSSAGTNLPPELFVRQMEYLRGRCRAVPLPGLLSSPIPSVPKTVSVTFDDGYEDNYTVAYSILKRYGIPATFFLTVSQVGRDWDFPRGPYPGLRWEQVKEMSEDPLIRFASHGLSHRDLRRLEEADARREIELSKALLEEKTGKPVEYFSYPHGAWSGPLKGAVVRAGYRAAFSVLSRGEDLFCLRRILISRSDTMFRFRLKLSPLYWPLRRLI